MKKPRTMSAYEANSFAKVCNLQRDHIDVEGYWILTDGHDIAIHKQNVGEPSKQQISIPRPVFNRLVSWYMKPQRLTKV